MTRADNARRFLSACTGCGPRGTGWYVMSLNPSNLIAANANPGRTMLPNLARHKDDTASYAEVDAAVLAELKVAGIPAEGPFESTRGWQEVPSAYAGNLCLWGFRRAWYYWIANGPGIPANKAEEFHKVWGKQCRVDGHCGCPSPLEWCHGFAVGSYHVDTQEGLVAFAELLRSIYIPALEGKP